MRGKRYADTSRRPEAVQSREKTNRKPRTVCLSYTLTHSHSFSTYLALYLSFSSSFVNRSRGGKEPIVRFASTNFLSFMLFIFTFRVYYISRIIKITRRDITSEIHALTEENTASLPLFRDRSTIRVVESAPLFLYLRSTRCPRAPRRARESHIFGLRLLTSLRSTVYEQHESTLTRRHTTLQIVSVPAAPCFFTSVHTLRTISLHTQSIR